MAWIGQIQSFLQREHWGCVQQTALQGLGRGYEQGPKGNGHTFESCRTLRQMASRSGSRPITLMVVAARTVSISVELSLALATISASMRARVAG
jgi:hypothetical protein